MRRGNPLIVEAALDLAWSHWTGLGARGGTTPPDTAVDPEALVHFTATLAPYDPRLWDQVEDWWRGFRAHVSRPRLKRLAARFDPAAVRRVESLDDRAGNRSTKVRLDDLRHPARTLLRLRSAFGDNARAELLLELLTRWRHTREGVTALTLAEVGYSKRNVALVLEDLRLAGVVTATADANRARYRLADPDALATWLAPIPLIAGQWHLRLPLIAGLVTLAHGLSDKDPIVQAADARRYLAGQKRALASLMITPPSIALAEVYWDQLQAWAMRELLTPPSVADHRRVAGMLAGAWLRPDQDPRLNDQPSSAVLPRLGADPDRAAELLCLDLVQVTTIDPPNDWTWMVLSEVATGVYTHADELRHGQRLRFATRASGATRIYVARYGPPIPWDEIASSYGDAAASRARRDHPAVQAQLLRES